MSNELSQNGRYNNCLSLIRIIAALQVILGHLIEHFELPITVNGLRAAYFLRGVPIFFAISGFLIWFSMERSQSYVDYLKKRFLRIYPELWLAVVVEIFVLVLLYRGWEINSLILFAVCQGSVLQFWTPESLRGYGVGTPNGALWTITVIIQFYIIAWAVYKLMKKRAAVTWIVWFIISFALSRVGTFIAHDFVGIEIVGKLYDQTIIKYFWLFYIGMFLAEFRDKLMMHLKKYWYLLLAVSLAFFWTSRDLFSDYYLGWSLFLTSGLIGFAYRFPELRISPDISYAMFLYHMTAINVFVHFGLTGSWVYVAPVLVIVVCVSFISTMTIGKISVYIKKSEVIVK